MKPDKWLIRLVLALYIASFLSGCVAIVRFNFGSNIQTSEVRDDTNSELDQDYTADIKRK